MQRSMTRIRTSHVGRRPSPKGWEKLPGRLASAEDADSLEGDPDPAPYVRALLQRP